jgi:hypothetical protein
LLWIFILLLLLLLLSHYHHYYCHCHPINIIIIFIIILIILIIIIIGIIVIDLYIFKLSFIFNLLNSFEIKWFVVVIIIVVVIQCISYDRLQGTSSIRALNKHQKKNTTENSFFSYHIVWEFYRYMSVMKVLKYLYFNFCVF